MSAALVSGCSSKEPANDTLPTATTSAEASPTLEPLGPPDLPMPAEAREQTPEGAEAFIRYYMDIYNSAQQSLDSTYLRQFSANCETCERLAEDIDADATAGYTYQGGDVSVDGIGKPGIESGRAQAAFAITQAALTISDSAGDPVEGLTFPARPSPSCGAILTWSASTASWIFAQWDVE